MMMMTVAVVAVMAVSWWGKMNSQGTGLAGHLGGEGRNSRVTCPSSSSPPLRAWQTLRKKGFNGCDSPEPDGEDSIDQSPLNDDKFRKTNEDLDILFKRYGVSVLPYLF